MCVGDKDKCVKTWPISSRPENTAVKRFFHSVAPENMAHQIYLEIILLAVYIFMLFALYVHMYIIYILFSTVSLSILFYLKPMHSLHRGVCCKLISLWVRALTFAQKIILELFININIRIYSNIS